MGGGETRCLEDLLIIARQPPRLLLQDTHQAQAKLLKECPRAAHQYTTWILSLRLGTVCPIFTGPGPASPQINGSTAWFIKFMAMVVVFLRKMGVQIYPYLDDQLIRSRSMALVEKHMKLVQSTYWNLGLQINEQKLMFELAQKIEFIGTVLDLTQIKAVLSENRFRAIEPLVNGLRTFPTTTARSCLKLWVTWPLEPMWCNMLDSS